MEKQVTKASFGQQPWTAVPAQPTASAFTPFNYVYQEIAIMAFGAKVLFIYRIPRNKPERGSQSEGLCADHSLWAALAVQDRLCGHVSSSYLISPNGVSY